MKPPRYQPDPAKLKRTNWTTEEVIELIEGQRLFGMDGKPSDDFGRHNDGIVAARQMFEDFLLPEDEFGAMAYDPVSNNIYHIGPRPPR